MYAQVVVNRPTRRRLPLGAEPVRGDRSWLAIYTYRLPPSLTRGARPGHLVQVPLRTSTALGVIIELTASPPADLPPETDIRDVADILDPLPVVTPTQMRLARWLAEAYLASLSQAMRLMLPPGLAERTFVVVSPTASPPSEPLSPDEEAALRLLHSQGRRMRLSVLLGRLSAEDPEAVIHSLADRGLVEARYALVPPKPAPPRVQYARLLADDEAIEAALPHLGRPSKGADVLQVLARHGGELLSLAEVCELAECGEQVVRSLARRGWLTITRRRTLVTALPGAKTADLSGAPKQAALLSALLACGAPVEQRQLLAETGVSSSTLRSLERKGLVHRIIEEPIVLPTLGPSHLLERILEMRGAQKQRRVLEILRGSHGPVWVGGLYAQTGADLADLRDLADLGLISLHAEEYERPRPTVAETALPLTPDQEAIWRTIEAELGPGEGREPFVGLLHGVTGSGKTEIYLRAVQAVLEAGRRAIVLVPEISLTAQTIRRFEARFPGRVAVSHSQLSLGQRYAAWERVRRGEADVVLGPRSALFAPVSRLGLVVLDEAHDDSYKQSEPIPLPAYDAREVAIALGRLTGATVLLGSATPDVVTFYRAQQGRYRLLQLPQRIVPSTRGRAFRPTSPPLPPVRIVDLRQELRAGNRSLFSRALQAALRRTLEAGEQAMLFLNRRGAATFVLCRDCGYVVRCPRCDVPLTYHLTAADGQRDKLVCHHCNYQQDAPRRCPECGGPHIRYFGLGTERVEAAVHQLLPQARLLRWDRDTARGVDHERFLQAFIDHRADVLIGTQMIAKGLDLPLVTLVGVISADTALYLPDYRAAERTFQLLTQVAGRAGRSQRGGQVIIQTYNPDHYAIQAAARHDFTGFYRKEIALRRQLGYPPFGRLVALRFSSRDRRRCRVEAERLGQWLQAEIQRLGLRASLIGPAPCFFSRVQGRYRWQIVVRAAEPLALLGDLLLPPGWQVDVDPVSLL